MLGQFRKAGIEPKMRVVEFPVTEDAVVNPGESCCACASREDPLTFVLFLGDVVGTQISAIHFVPGQHVDVQAPS